MKKIKYLLLSLLAACLILSGCQASGTTGVDSEKAMDNFLAKIEAGNYVMDAKNYLKTTVASRDQVVFDYVEDMYTDSVYMSVNNESFKGILNDQGVEEVSFVSEGQAIDAARKRLPNYWLDISGGNIWDLFYNLQEEPLKFVSHDENVKMSLLSFVGYNETAMRLMQDVYLVLDKEDPTSARLQAVVDDDLVARINYDDIDLEITFGNAESCPQAEAWMNAPVYPDARKDWNEMDEFIFNSVFLPGYGLEAIPFPEFAGYSLTVDEENFVIDDEVKIRDHSATKEDLAAYAETLLANGFAETKTTAEDGSEKTVYRKALREVYKCYSEIELGYDDGVDITARKYYDFPVYDSLAEINAQIKAIGYPELEDSANFLSWKGTDRACEMSESWLYFFDYDLGLYVDTEYEDYDETLAYLQEYIDTLTAAGFVPVASEEEGEPEYYESANGSYSFRYNFTEEGLLSMLFKSERDYSAAETEKMITAAGFPAIDLNETVSCRDLKLFRKIRYGQDEKAYLSVSQEFESSEEAEAFLSAYEEALNAAGFDRVNPDNVGSLKGIAIYNEEKEMYVGIDYFPDSAFVALDFVAE